MQKKHTKRKQLPKKTEKMNVRKKQKNELRSKNSKAGVRKTKSQKKRKMLKTHTKRPKKKQKCQKTHENPRPDTNVCGLRAYTVLSPQSSKEQDITGEERRKDVASESSSGSTFIGFVNLLTSPRMNFFVVRLMASVPARSVSAGSTGSLFRFIRRVFNRRPRGMTFGAAAFTTVFATSVLIRPYALLHVVMVCAAAWQRCMLFCHFFCAAPVRLTTLLDAAAAAMRRQTWQLDLSRLTVPLPEVVAVEGSSNISGTKQMALKDPTPYRLSAWRRQASSHPTCSWTHTSVVPRGSQSSGAALMATITAQNV